MFVGDGDRDRVTAVLREQYARGRLTLEEFSSRADLVLAARSRGELRGALAGLPAPLEAADVARYGRSLARGAALVVATGAYLLFSLALLLVLTVTLLVGGASGSVLVGFLVVWLVPTYLLFRVWHRPRR